MLAHLIDSNNWMILDQIPVKMENLSLFLLIYLDIIMFPFWLTISNWTLTDQWTVPTEKTGKVKGWPVEWCGKPSRSRMGHTEEE